ncbi:MAG: hypothetical protein R3C05_15305 [Pirellulaceae bacterium]
MENRSPGEVQLQELQFELRLKEAEEHDNRRREEHEERIKEFELQIERRLYHEEVRRADEVRQRYAEVISQVAQSQEKLSIQLERKTREFAVKLQMMEHEHDTRRRELQEEQGNLSPEIRFAKKYDVWPSCNSLLKMLTPFANRSRKDGRRSARQELAQIGRQITKSKELNGIRRDPRKSKLRNSRQPHHAKNLHSRDVTRALPVFGTEPLVRLGFEKNHANRVSTLREQAETRQTLSEQEVAAIREEAVEQYRRRFSIPSDEPLNVTELFYERRKLLEENAALQAGTAKLEAEMSRMRAHIEKESERVAKAIEAARTNIQNNIEPGVKR